jgi:YhcG PDDEXK nuclease domain
VLDEKVKLPQENPSIGIVLCKEKNNTIVEFAVRSIDKAMGVATYRTTKEVPKEMQGILPDAAELARLL